jgi:hypothetical protein
VHRWCNQVGLKKPSQRRRRSRPRAPLSRKFSRLFFAAELVGVPTLANEAEATAAVSTAVHRARSIRPTSAGRHFREIGPAGLGSGLFSFPMSRTSSLLPSGQLSIADGTWALCCPLRFRDRQSKAGEQSLRVNPYAHAQRSFIHGHADCRFLSDVIVGGVVQSFSLGFPRYTILRNNRVPGRNPGYVQRLLQSLHFAAASGSDSLAGRVCPRGDLGSPAVSRCPLRFMRKHGQAREFADCCCALLVLRLTMVHWANNARHVLPRRCFGRVSSCLLHRSTQPRGVDLHRVFIVASVVGPG